MIKYFFISFFAIISLAKINAQTTVEAALDSGKMLIGDQMKLHLTTSDIGATMSLVETTPLDSTKNVEILSKGVWEQINDKGNRFWRRDITFTVWDSGFYAVPPLRVSYERASQKGVALTSRATFRVNLPAGADTTQVVAPIKDVVREPFQWQDALPYIFAGLAALAVLIGGIWFFNRGRKKLKPPVSKKANHPPHILAALKLAELKRSTLLSEGKIKEYHSELSYIIREYLEGRYKTPALESVTGDVMNQVKKLGFSQTQTDHLQELLETSDLAKFAKAIPPDEAHHQMMLYAEQLIEATKPVEVAIVENGKAPVGQ